MGISLLYSVASALAGIGETGNRGNRERLSVSSRRGRLPDMKCGYCREWAGWLTKVCADCQRLLDIYEAHKGQVGFLQFLDLFIETGLPREKVDSVLAADPRGEGCVKDRILAAMTTEELGPRVAEQRQSA